MAIVENGRRAAPAWWADRAVRAKVLAYAGGLLLLPVAVALPVLVMILDLDEPWQSASVWGALGIGVFVKALFWFLNRPARNGEIQREAARQDDRDQARAGMRTGSSS